jgi:enamine deaminase RidA (YjgF/YER057c/UK114 family)
MLIQKAEITALPHSFASGSTEEQNMNQRMNISSGTKWESIVGYSRAVRLGNLVVVAGTTAVDDNGAIVGRDDPYLQTRFILAKIEKALQAAGAGLEDVVQTRMYVSDISRWEEIGRAHGEVFSAIRPTATMVEVKGLIDPALLVEIEALAVLDD